MAESHEIISGDDKAQFRESLTDDSKNKYSTDKVDDADAVDDIYSQANPAREGFTKNDQKDMYRMGKVQELKVRTVELLRAN